MKNRQKGFSAIQMLGAVASVAAVATVGVPKYEAYLVETRMTEAFSLASDAKTKLTEFYITANRFPKNEKEASAISTDSFSPPEYVREIRVNPESELGEVAIEIYFKEDALAEGVGTEDYVYIAGTSSNVPGSLVEWTCGAQGIDESYLPTRCTN